MPEYVLHLRALPSDIPPVIRLRRALKTLLRSHRLRCVSVSEAKGADAPDVGASADRAGNKAAFAGNGIVEGQTTNVLLGPGGQTPGAGRAV